MSWEISVQLDLDQTDVGTVTGTWTDPNTALGVFTYSRRVKANVAGANTFKTAAIAARDNWQIKQQANIDGAVYVKQLIDTADPKVEV